MKLKKIILSSLSVFLLGCTVDDYVSSSASAEPTETAVVIEDTAMDPDTQCDDKACVAMYLNVFGELPSNYMTKEEARERGWSSGALHLVVEGMCIGGDYFGNYEGLLPEEDTYHECDIDTLNSDSRGAKRIIYSEDGDIYYTEDHYETFELLYGDGE